MPGKHALTVDQPASGRVPTALSEAPQQRASPHPQPGTHHHKRTRIQPAGPASSPYTGLRGPGSLTGALPAAGEVLINRTNTANRAAAAHEVIDLVSSSSLRGEADGQAADVAEDEVTSGARGEGAAAAGAAGKRRPVGDKARSTRRARLARPAVHGGVGGGGTDRPPNRPTPALQQPKTQTQTQLLQDRRPATLVSVIAQTPGDTGSDHPVAQQLEGPGGPQLPVLFQPAMFQEAGTDVLAALAHFATEFVRTAPLPVIAPLPPLPCSRTGEVANITTLEQLQAWLDRHSCSRGVTAPGTDLEPASSVARSTASPGTAMLDLKGATVRAGGQVIQRLRVTGSICSSGNGVGGSEGGNGNGSLGAVGTSILICNGRIQGCAGVVVEGSIEIAFVNVTFTSTPPQPSPAAAMDGGPEASAAASVTVHQHQKQQWDALLVVRGAGSRARLKNCKMVLKPKSTGAEANADAGGVSTEGDAGRSSSSAMSASAASGAGGGMTLSTCHTGCVLALQGGCVELLGQCELIGGPCFGLAAVGAGACARAELAKAVRAGTAGFLAAYGGALTALKCSVEGTGAAAHDLFITAAGFAFQCSGFAAVDGGALFTEQCVAQRCAWSGFLSCGPGADLSSSGRCRAEENGHAGFLSVQGATLRAGPKCRSVLNKQFGFRADLGGTLTAADQTAAECNDGPGWVAAEGAVLILGCSCRAVDNGGSGFMALGDSLLFAGAGCVAQRNSADGWFADESAQLVVAAECKASANRGRGFAVLGRTPGSIPARLVTGPECVAEKNEGGGFATVQYGRMMLGPGCAATGNYMDGFMASNGGRLEAGCGGGGCVARGNGQHGFCAEDPGSVLVAGPECSAVGNKGWGAVVSGGGALLRLGVGGWQAEGNMQGPAGQENGGQLEWLQ